MANFRDIPYFAYIFLITCVGILLSYVLETVYSFDTIKPALITVRRLPDMNAAIFIVNLTVGPRDHRYVHIICSQYAGSRIHRD